MWEASPSPTHFGIGFQEPKRICVSEMGFSRVALAHQNMRFGKKMDKRVVDEESLILVGNVVTRGMEQQQFLKMALTPRKLVHWGRKEMKTKSKRAKIVNALVIVICNS